MLTKAALFRNQCSVTEDQLKVGRGWLKSFKKRCNITSKKSSGEVVSANKTAAKEFLESIDEVIGDYDGDYIFNLDETGLFFRMQPDRSNSTKKLDGRKSIKDRVTLVLCCNMTGTAKLPLYFIRKYQNPHCLTGISRDNLGVDYRANKSTCVLTYNFQEICINLENYCRNAGKKVCYSVTTLLHILLDP
ncbi:hypothetical protein GEMRC1_009571 [Eukaryota sp. GEM-RC1]